MTTDPYQQWLQQLATTARTEMLRHYTHRDNCVLATALSLEVLRYFGIHAKPNPVKIAAFSSMDALERWATTGQLGPDDYTVGTAGTGRIATRPGRGLVWDGHLVTLLHPVPRLLDLSIDQYHRPHSGVHLPEPLVTEPIKLDDWHPDGRVAVLTPSGAPVVYDYLQDDGWRAGGSWTDRNNRGNRAIVGAVIRQLSPPPIDTILPLASAAARR